MHIKRLSFLLVFISAAAFSQVGQVRYELPLRHVNDEAYNTISLGEKGVFLFSLFYGPEQNALEVIRLDTALQDVWKGFIQVEKRLAIVTAKANDDVIYILLKDRFAAIAEFVVVTINIANGNFGTRVVKTLLAFQPSSFTVTKNAALIGGYFNYRPLVLYYNFSTGQSRILPGFFNDIGELNQVRADENGNIDIVVSDKTKNIGRRHSLWIRSYDANGDLTKTILLQGADNVHLIYGRAISQPGGNMIVAGTYGRYSEYSRGLFVANVDPFGEYTINYYNYGDLQRFFNYMKPRRERRVMERIARRKIRGRKIRLNYRLMVDDLMAYGKDQYILLGEAFYPHYSYPSSRNGLYGSNLGARTTLYPTGYGRSGDMVFDGYQYTHAVVIGFDKDGKLKWDNSFEINDVRTMFLEQFVKVHPDKEKISLLYLFDNVIRTKIIKDSQVLEGKSYDQIQTGLPDDVVRERDTQQTKVDYWYGDTFYATGVQLVRKKNMQGENYHRRVFFINKIIYK